MTEKLRCERLGLTIDGTQIVSNVSLTVDASEFVVVTGPSGSGKSTLLRLLNRLDEPTSGTVYLDGVDYREIPPTELRRRVSLVLQSNALLDGTVFENASWGVRLLDRDVERSTVESALSSVGLDTELDRSISGLSGGERQRLALVRTLLIEPEVLLLDEPTANLDSTAKRRVESVLQERREADGTTIVMVTHDTDQGNRLADRIVELRDGTIATVGPTDAVAR